jgi:hypothetical protein
LRPAAAEVVNHPFSESRDPLDFIPTFKGALLTQPLSALGADHGQVRQLSLRRRIKIDNAVLVVRLAMRAGLTLTGVIMCVFRHTIGSNNLVRIAQHQSRPKGFVRISS